MFLFMKGTKMPRCSQKTKSGKRCKKNTCQFGRCTAHMKVFNKAYDNAPPRIVIPEIRWCGHMGCELWDKICCLCADKRPHADIYMKYVDGYGELPIGQRDDGYCPTCKDPAPEIHPNVHLAETYMKTMDAVASILATYTEPELRRVLAKTAEIKQVRGS